jgi:hypothetical protein
LPQTASVDKIGRVCDAVKDDPEPSALASASQVLEDVAQETSKPKDEDDPSAASGLAINGLLVAVVALLLV